MYTTQPLHWKWTLLTLPVVAAGLLLAAPARAEVECRWRGDRLECRETDRDRRDRYDRRYNDRRRDSERRRCTYSSYEQEYVCR